MRRLAFAAVAVALAWAIGATASSPSTSADPDAVLAISADICLALSGSPDCLSLNKQPSMRGLLDVIAEDPDKPTPADFSSMDLDLNQLHDRDGGLWIIAFVDDDAPVRFKTNKGNYALEAPASPKKDILCGPASELTSDFSDEDCNANGKRGDGIIAALLQPDGASRGPGQASVIQSRIVFPLDFTVVGEPDSVEFLTLETAVQTGVSDIDGDGNLSSTGECPLPFEASKLLALHGTAERAIILGIVRDSDGTAISGAFLNWSTDDEDLAVASLPVTPTLDLGSFGVAAPNLICGTEESGTATITAAITRTVSSGGVIIGIDPYAELDDGSIEFIVGGAPSGIALQVSPPEIPCDGSAAAEVAATVTDADGNPVVNGNEVRFDVQVLGTASPMVATTTDGVAKSKIVAVAPAGTGVPVTVRAGDAVAQTAVKCGAVSGAPAAAPPPPPPSGQAPAPSRPTTGALPATHVNLPGSGVASASESGGLPWLALVAMTGVALGLSASALAARRKTR